MCYECVFANCIQIFVIYYRCASDCSMLLHISQIFHIIVAASTAAQCSAIAARFAALLQLQLMMFVISAKLRHFRQPLIQTSSTLYIFEYAYRAIHANSFYDLRTLGQAILHGYNAWLWCVMLK